MFLCWLLTLCQHFWSQTEASAFGVANSPLLQHHYYYQYLNWKFLIQRFRQKAAINLLQELVELERKPEFIQMLSGLAAVVSSKMTNAKYYAVRGEHANCPWTAPVSGTTNRARRVSAGQMLRQTQTDNVESEVVRQSFYHTFYENFVQRGKNKNKNNI